MPEVPKLLSKSWYLYLDKGTAIFGVGCLILISIIIGKGYYCWHLERYGGTYCYEHDAKPARWIYVRREDMLDAIYAEPFMGEHVVRLEDGSLEIHADGTLVTYIPSIKQIYAESRNERKRILRLYPLHEIFPASNPLKFVIDLIIQSAYTRQGVSFNAKYLSGCNILRNAQLLSLRKQI